MYDFIAAKLFYFHDISATVACVYDYSPTSFSILGNTTSTFTYSSPNSFAFSNSATSGQNNIIPIRGMWWMTPQKYGTNTAVASNNSFYARIITNSPNATTSTGNVQILTSATGTASISTTPFGMVS